MGHPTASRRGERGFTLIEVMIAATVLVIGVLSTFRLIDGANATTSLNGARLGAMGLAREVVEYARGSDYDKLQPSLLETSLRQRSSITGTGTPWTVRRRGVTYTVTDTVCAYDDPKDGIGSTPPDNPCLANATPTTPPDANPDDFRRVTIKLDWTVRGHRGTLTQSALVVNPAGALGPRIIALWDASTTEVGPQAANASASVDFGGVSRPVTTTTAAGVHWSADDGVSGGDATGGPTDWSFSWQLGNDTPHLHPLTFDNTWVPDGNYTIQVQAVDARGVPGEARTTVVHINRHRPAPVTGFQGGYDTQFGGVVDLHWQRYPERDVVGYRVYRDKGTASSTVVCPSGGSSTYTTAITCTDPNPGNAGSTHTYTVVAMDCTSLLGACSPREGDDSSPVSVTLGGGSPLLSPSGLSASIVDGLPKLTWTAVPGARFYRIYRDGDPTSLTGRYDETITNDPTYTDPKPGDTTRHTYYVTTVDNSFNESGPSDPIVSPG